MSKGIRNLLMKTEGANKEALDAMLMLSNIFTYGLYGEKKDLELAKFWLNKAKELEQNLMGAYDGSRKKKEENIKNDNITVTNRFDNIQNNLEFVGIKDNIDESKEKRKISRFDNIQNNLKFVKNK